MRKIRLLFISSTFFMLSSCANYKMHIEGEQFQTAPASLGEPEHIMYLLGDAGDAALGEVPPAVKFFGKKLADAPENSSCIILGDNIYPKGLPPRNDPGRELAEHRIKMQLDILKDFKGKPFFIPGNHDWYQDERRKGVERVEKFVEEYLDRGDVWLPDDGCSGPVAEDLSETVVGLFVDSEWFRMNWQKERELNEGCDIKSREAFAFFVQDEMKKNRRKNIVVAMHHPPYTNGPHGGKYSARQHIFPMTDFAHNLYIPLPVLGSVFQFIRATAGSREDNSHPQANELKRIMESSAKKNGNFIFVSGHEHCLQYFDVDGQQFIVSGAGSKNTPVGKGRGMQFGYGKETGFSILKFYPEGEVFLEMWTANPDGEGGKLVFSRKIKGKLPLFKTEIPTEFPEFGKGKDSISVALNPEVKDGKTHRFFWGDHYRQAYKSPVKAPVLDLSAWKGGVTPVKRGGGSQTNSLRVEDSKGHQWVLRSMVKDESRTIPYPFNQTFAKDVFADQFTSANPYVAFVIPRMAAAIDIYHPNPKLYYLPKQPQLGDFNDLYGGGLYLVEERADGDWRDLASFGFSKELVSTPDLIEKKEKNANHRIDGPFTVRSRLFDNLVGDFDRHDDNWRWASFKDKETGVTTYRPIPRDRDQPFIKYDGLLPGILSHGVPFLKQLKVYDKKIKNIKWVNYHSKYFDPTFLSEPDWQVWEREAKHIMENLTDEVIDSAMHDFPREIYALDGAWIAERLKGRRENMLEIAREFYLLVSKKVDVVGTNDQDYFEVERLDDERTRVRVYASNKEGDKKEVFYERTFLTSETREIRLYGLDQEDRFHITGNVSKGILVRCIGGLDDDFFTDESTVGGFGKKTKVYDTKGDNHLKLGSEAANRTSNNPVMNTYDRRSWDTEHNYGIGVPFLAGNPDDGLALGWGALFSTFGFKKSPFGSRHLILGKFSFETGSWDVNYNGEFIRALGQWDFLAHGRLQGPLYTRNFFGYGNDSPYYLDDEAFDDNFIRLRQQLYGAYPTLRRKLSDSFSISFGGSAEAIEIEDTPDRLVNRDNEQIRGAVFETQFFSGGEVQVNFLNSDNLVNPTQGLNFNLTAGWKANLQETDRSFAYFGGSLGIVLGGNPVVLASRAGFRHATGDFEFYQAPTLGARSNLRGFRNERFTGNTVVYHQNDLRIRLANVKNYVLPFTLGVLGGYDYGRAWSDLDESDNWHDSYGGGIWLSPFDLAVLTFSYFQSDDGPRFEFRGGFAF
jgi:hypothetical protein